MKKLKKISLVRLSSEELEKNLGGAACYGSCVYETCGEAFVMNASTSCGEFTSFGGSGSGGTENCQCACGVCSMEDGGLGFKMGMFFSNIG